MEAGFQADIHQIEFGRGYWPQTEPLGYSQVMRENTVWMWFTELIWSCRDGNSLTLDRKSSTLVISYPKRGQRFLSRLLRCLWRRLVWVGAKSVGSERVFLRPPPSRSLSLAIKLDLLLPLTEVLSDSAHIFRSLSVPLAYFSLKSRSPRDFFRCWWCFPARCSVEGVVDWAWWSRRTHVRDIRGRRRLTFWPMTSRRGAIGCLEEGFAASATKHDNWDTRSRTSSISSYTSDQALGECVTSGQLLTRSGTKRAFLAADKQFNNLNIKHSQLPFVFTFRHTLLKIVPEFKVPATIGCLMASLSDESVEESSEAKIIFFVVGNAGKGRLTFNDKKKRSEDNNWTRAQISLKLRNSH